MANASSEQRPWLGLVVGNTRLHWAYFWGETLVNTWHTRHVTTAEAIALMQHQFAPLGWRSLVSESAFPMPVEPPPRELYIASVVPRQTALWDAHPHRRLVTLSQLPLTQLYPTLGIDRALNLLGAGDRYGWPALVIDAGTALTFTGGENGALVGGAILPGIAMQFQALTERTATLPEITATADLPPRWASDTPKAIQSGILHGVVAIARDFISDWQARYPDGAIVFTGGNGAQLYTWLTQQSGTSPGWHQDADLMFWGMCRCRQNDVLTDR